MDFLNFLTNLTYITEGSVRAGLSFLSCKPKVMCLILAIYSLLKVAREK